MFSVVRSCETIFFPGILMVVIGGTINKTMTLAVTEHNWIISRTQFLTNLQLDTFSGSAANVTGYGHLGDSNLHLNISTPQYDAAVIF